MHVYVRHSRIKIISENRSRHTCVFCRILLIAAKEAAQCSGLWWKKSGRWSAEGAGEVDGGGTTVSTTPTPTGCRSPGCGTGGPLRYLLCRLSELEEVEEEVLLPPGEPPCSARSRDREPLLVPELERSRTI
jgi:hypothetical protein